MSKLARMLIEVLAPPFLVAIWLSAGALRSEPLADGLFFFLPLLAFCYLFGILPAGLYTIGMEVWFRSGLHARLGVFHTVGISTAAGVGAGWLSSILVSGCLGPTGGHFIMMGGVIGAALGFLTGFYAPNNPSTAA